MQSPVSARQIRTVLLIEADAPSVESYKKATDQTKGRMHGPYRCANI